MAPLGPPTFPRSLLWTALVTGPKGAAPPAEEKVEGGESWTNPLKRRAVLKRLNDNGDSMSRRAIHRVKRTDEERKGHMQEQWANDTINMGMREHNAAALAQSVEQVNVIAEHLGQMAKAFAGNQVADKKGRWPRRKKRLQKFWRSESS